MFNKSILSVLVIAAVIMQLVMTSGTEARILTVSKQGFSNSTNCTSSLRGGSFKNSIFRLHKTGPCLTIAQAMKVAVSGDIIEVWPGVYYENVVFTRKNVTIRSLSGVDSVKIVASLNASIANKKSSFANKTNIAVRMSLENSTLQDVTVQIVREWDLRHPLNPRKALKFQFWQKYPDVGVFIEKGKNQRVIGCKILRGRTNATTPKSVGILVDSTASYAIVGSNIISSNFPISIESRGNFTRSFENSVYYAIFRKSNAISYFDFVQVSNNPAYKVVAVVRPSRDTINLGPLSKLANKGAYTYSPTIVGYATGCNLRRFDNRLCVDNAWYNPISGNCECDTTQGFQCNSNNFCIVNTTFFAPNTYFNNVGTASDRFTNGYYDRVVRLRSGDSLAFVSDFGYQELWSYNDIDSWTACSTANRKLLATFNNVVGTRYTIATSTTTPEVYYLASQNCSQGVKFIVVSYLRGIASRGTVFQTPLVKLGDVSAIWGQFGGYGPVTAQVAEPLFLNPSPGTAPATLVLYPSTQSTSCNISQGTVVAPTQQGVVNPVLLGLPGSYYLATSDPVGCNYSQRVAVTVTSASQGCFLTQYFNINASVAVESANAIPDLSGVTIQQCVQACWASAICKFAVYNYSNQFCSLLNFRVQAPINTTNQTTGFLNHAVLTPVQCDGSPRDFTAINTIFVSAVNGTDAEGYGFNFTNPVKTLTYALGLALNGTRIMIQPGTYNGNADVPVDNLQILGNGTGVQIVGNLTALLHQNLTFNNVNIQGFVNFTNVFHLNFSMFNITSGALSLTNVELAQVYTGTASNNITVVNGARLFFDDVDAVTPGNWIVVTGTSFANAFYNCDGFRNSAADVNNNRFFPIHGCATPAIVDDFTTECSIFTRRTASGHCACDANYFTCDTNANRCVPLNNSIVILNTSADNAATWVPIGSFAGPRKNLMYEPLQINSNDNIVFNYANLTAGNKTLMRYRSFAAFIFCNNSEADVVSSVTSSSLTITTQIPQNEINDGESFFGDFDNCVNGQRIIVRWNGTTSGTPRNIPVSINFPFFGAAIAANRTVNANDTIVAPSYDDTYPAFYVRNQSTFQQCGTTDTVRLQPNDAGFSVFNLSAFNVSTYYFYSTVQLCAQGLGKAVYSLFNNNTNGSTTAPNGTSSNNTNGTTIPVTNTTGNVTGNATGNVTAAPNATEPSGPTLPPAASVKAVVTIDGDINAFRSNPAVQQAALNDLIKYYFPNGTKPGDSVTIDSVQAGSVIILYTVTTANQSAVQQIQQKTTVPPPIPALQAAYFAATGQNVTVDPTRTGGVTSTTCPTIGSNTTVQLNSTAAWLVAGATCAGQSNATTQCSCYQSAQTTIINDIRNNCQNTNGVTFLAPVSYANATQVACSATPAPISSASSFSSSIFTLALAVATVVALLW